MALTDAEKQIRRRKKMKENGLKEQQVIVHSTKDKYLESVREFMRSDENIKLELNND